MEESAQIIQKELGAHEHVLWQGCPRQGVMLRSSDAVIIPFSLLWGGFAIFWEAMALTQTCRSSGPVWVLPIFGIPFVLFGLYLIVGRFFVDAQQRAKTYYGVTDERIIIISGLFNKGVKSLNIRTLTDISLAEQAGGYGTISFGPVNPFSGRYPQGLWSGMSNMMPNFDTIPQAKDVYDRIRKAQTDAK